MLRLLSALAILGLAQGCAPDADAPVRVRALVLSTGGEYVPQEVELKTVTDPVKLTGSVLEMRGGGSIRFDVNDLLLQNAYASNNPQAIKRAVLKSEGDDVRVSYISRDGVLWPTDFHSWNLVTAYYGFEKAYEYFNVVANIPGAELGTSRAYYFPQFVDTSGGDAKEQRDNAIFYSLVEGFMILPFDEFQKVPFSINAGVIAHEYAHWVFNRKTYQGAIYPVPLMEWGAASSQPGVNILKSLDEGLADFHAWAATCESAFGCNPRFISSSLEDDRTSAARDLSAPDRCMTTSLRQSMLTASYGDFVANWPAGGQYEVGAILASALFQAAESTGQRQVLSRAIVNAYSDGNASTPGLAQIISASLADQSSFTMAKAVGAIVSHIDDLELKRAVCGEFLDHLQIPLAELQGEGLCPDSSSSGIACKSIN